MSALDPYAVPDELAARFVGVGRMAEMLGQPDSPTFFVMLTRYFIEGEPYMASMLTVSATATPNLVQTQDGFACDAYFPPDLLTPHGRAGKDLSSGSVQVQLEARLEDLMLIQGQTPTGEQITLLTL